MNLSKNFTLSEMIASSTAAKRGIKNIPDKGQIENLGKLCREVLQPVRDKINCPLIVTSGFRSPVLNHIVGGSATSQHLRGEAADIVSVNNLLLWQITIKMVEMGEIEVGQLINEKNLSWRHISLPTSTHKNQILSIL